MKYKITKRDNKYFIRNTFTNMIYDREFRSYEEARSALSINFEVQNLMYILDQDMYEKLKPLYAIARESKLMIDRE